MRPSSRSVPPGRPPRGSVRTATPTARRAPHRIPARVAEGSQAPPPPPAPPPAPTPGPTPRRSRRRLLLGAVAVVGVALLLVEGVALVRGIDSEESAHRLGTLPLQPPADLPPEGSLVLSTVRAANGTVEVTQWIRSGDDITTLSVSAPDLGDAGAVTATDAHVVAADGTTIVDDLTVGAEPRELVLDTPTRLVRATYVLRGAADESATVEGRVLARVVSIDLGFPTQTGPTVVVVGAAGEGVVRNLACADARSAVALLRPCGTPDGDRWRVRLPPEGRDDAVAAQVDAS